MSCSELIHKKWYLLGVKDFTVIVPVRAGSTRVPGKNLRTFDTQDSDGGSSLLSWKLNQLLELFESDQVVLSTDWSLAAAVGEKFQVRVHHRDPRLCTSDAPFDEVISDSASLVSSEHMIWAPVTSPFLGPKRIKEMLDFYLESSSHTQAEGLIAVSSLRSYFFLSNSPINFPIGKGHVRTQELSPLSELNWAFSIRQTSAVLSNSYMFGLQPVLFEVTKLENLDIDDQLDFKMAQHLIPLYLEYQKNHV